MGKAYENSRPGIYLIVNPNGKRYVGSSVNLTRRLSRYKNLSCKNQPAIYSSLKKYGYENHKVKILMHCDREDLLFWERAFGDMYLSLADFDNGLNIQLPGYDDKPRIMSEEQKKKISEQQKNRFLSEDERKRTSKSTKKGFTEEVKRKLSETHKKRFENPELRKKRSEDRKNYYIKNPEARLVAAEKTKQVYLNNPELREKSNNALKKFREENPNYHSELMKKKYLENPELAKNSSIRNKQYYIDNPEARKKASERTKLQLANGHPNSKKIINTDTNEIFENINFLIPILGKCKNTIRKWLSNESLNPTTYKYL
jgi:group I intron endonuclease